MTHEDTATVRGAEATGSRQGAASSRDTAATMTFNVEFGMRAGLSTVPADSFKFVGKGSIAFVGDSVTIAGGRKRPFMSSLKETHLFSRREIVNAATAGKTVRFQVRSANEPLRNVQFSAATTAQARAIVFELPREQTEEFIRSQASIADFHQRLARFSPHAFVTPTLVALNVAVFLAMCIGGMNAITPDGETAVRWGSNFGPLTMSGQWWRLFSATFIHFGIIHLAFNMWALFQNGRTIERLFGSTRFLLLYVFAGLTGSVASLLWNPQVNSAGASGAIFGIFGGLLAFVINPRNEVPKEVMVEHRNSTLLFTLYSLFYGVAHTGIDNAAHIGGLAGGFLMGLVLARPLNAEHRSSLGVPRLLLALGGGAVVLALMLWPLANPSGDAQATARFESSLATLHTRDKATVDAANALLEHVRAGNLSDLAYVDDLQKTIAPQWDAIYDDLAAAKLPASNKDHALQQALLRYADARRQEIHAAYTYVHAASVGNAAGKKTWTDAKQNTKDALDEVNRLMAARK